MNQFILTLQQITKTDTFDVNRYDVIEGKSLVELMSKLLIIIASIQRSIEFENEIKRDDDIPF